MDKKILITGAAGYIGYQLGQRLSKDFDVIGIDIRTREDADFPIHCIDIRSDDMSKLMAFKKITHVVHLASVVEPSGDRYRDFDIDVTGTQCVLDACVRNAVTHITVTSSGAAYGYHHDNPSMIGEMDDLRGNVEFSYSDHKRQVEELLKQYRNAYPQLQQLIFRPCTVLGADTDNMITKLFTNKRLLAVRGAASPFVFVWDQDVLAAIEKGVKGDFSGVYNLAGDGSLTVAEIAKMLDKPVLSIPAWIIKVALFFGKLFKLTIYGPEQVNFLRYRPVLSNTRLKNKFGFEPEKNSLEVFQYYVDNKLNNES